MSDNSGQLQATPSASELGLSVFDWQDGAEAYLSALERRMFNVNTLLGRVASSVEPTSV